MTLILLALGLIGLIVVAVILGQPKPTGARPSRAMLAERGEAMGFDEGDGRYEKQGRKIADDVGIPVHFRYANAAGSPSARAVMIDGIYGASLDAPEYFRGRDSATGEERTFRVDRITALSGEGGEITEDIGWWLGNVVRHQLGQPTSPAPYQVATDLPVRIEVDVHGKGRGWFRGTITEVRRCYRESGPVVEVRFEGMAETGPRRARNFGCVLTGEGWNRIVTVCDPETGEVIEDLEARATGQRL